MVLGRAIYGLHGDLLLARGKALDSYFISRLAELGFPGVYIEEPGFEVVDPPEIIDGSLRASTEVLLSECMESLSKLTPLTLQFDGTLSESLESHPELKRAIPIGRLRATVKMVVQELLDQFSTQLPCLLLKAQSRYQVQHAMDSMLVSTLLGINFRFIYRELHQLALATLLHDVGKTLLATNNEANIGPDHPKYQEHPLIGGLLVLHSGDDLYTECAAIQQHHERQDGSGFPYGLRGEGKSPIKGRGYTNGTIYRLAEIVAVADIYDVLCAGAYRDPLSPEHTIQELINRSPAEFNPHVVKMLGNVIQIYPVGCQVRIKKCSDPQLRYGRGVVSKVNPEFPHQADIILTHDNSGNRISPTPVSLAGDEKVRLDLIL